MKKILIYSLGVVALLSTTSCNCRTSVSSLDNQTDSLSYVFGVMNGASIGEAKASGMYAELNDLDVDLFIKGLDEALNSDKSQNSYYLGLTQGAQMKQYFERMASDPGVQYDIDVFLAAFAQAFEGDTTLLIKSSDARSIYSAMMDAAVKAKEQAELDSIAATPEAKANLEAGVAFLAAKEQEEGVQKTASGLLYKVIKAGKGETIKPSDRVEVKYVGKFINDSIFDSNDNTRFGANQGIAGWNEGMQLMAPGAKYELYIPADLAYGVRGNSRIPSNSTLVFEVEILGLVK